MNRIKLNYFIDILLAISFILVGLTGVLKTGWFLRTVGLNYASIPIRTISFIHDWSGIAFVLLAILHLILHFNWLVAMTKQFVLRKRA